MNLNFDKIDHPTINWDENALTVADAKQTMLNKITSDLNPSLRNVIVNTYIAYVKDPGDVVESVYIKGFTVWREPGQEPDEDNQEKQYTIGLPSEAAGPKLNKAIIAIVEKLNNVQQVMILTDTDFSIEFGIIEFNTYL